MPTETIPDWAKEEEVPDWAKDSSPTGAKSVESKPQEKLDLSAPSLSPEFAAILARDNPIAAQSMGLFVPQMPKEGSTWEDVKGIATDPLFGEIPMLDKNASDSALKKVGKGVSNTAAGALNFIQSPAGIASLGIGALPGVVQKSLGLGFGATMAPTAGEKLGEAYVTKDPQDITEGLLMAGGAILPALHARTVFENPEPGKFQTRPIGEDLAKMESRDSDAKAESAGSPFLRNPPGEGPIQIDPFAVDNTTRAPSGMSMAGDISQSPRLPGGIPAGAELDAMKPQRPASAIQPPDAAASGVTYQSGRAAQALRERAAAEARQADSQKAAAEKVSQGQVEPIHPDKPLTENQLRIVNESLRKAFEDNQLPAKDGGLLETLSKAADDARTRLESRSGKTTFGSGPFHEIPNIADYAIILAHKIAQGGYDFAKWSSDAVKQYGEVVKPHIQALWDEANNQIQQFTKEIKQPEEASISNFAKNLESPEFKGGNDLSNAAGLAVKSVDDLNTLAGLREKYASESREATKELTKVIESGKDATEQFKKVQAIGQKAQLSREAIEVATNVGGWEEGAGTKLGSRPLDWSKNPESAQWLKDNSERLGIDASKVTVPETTVESVTPLNPETGAPLSGMDSMINRTQAASLPIVKQKGLISGSKLEKWADAELKDLSGWGRTNTLPVDIAAKKMAAVAIKGAALMERGIVNSAEWTAAMIKEYGPEIRSKLSQIRKMSEEMRAGNFHPKTEQVKESIPESGLKMVEPKTVESRLTEDSKTPKQPIESEYPKQGIVAGIRNRLRRISDFVTIDPVPKLTRSGVGQEAVQHVNARTAVPIMVEDFLARVFPDQYKNPEAMSKTMDILNKDDILGGYDEFINRRDAAAAEGDTRAANKWQKMADNVGEKQDIDKLFAEVQAAKNDPVIAANIQRWKDVVNPELDQLYNEVKGVNPNTPREGRGRVFGSRVNLLPKSEEENWIKSLEDDNKPIPSASSSNYRNPNVKRDKFDRVAKFTGEYSTNPAAVLSNVLAPRWNEATKLRFYNAMVNKGVARWAEQGEKTPETIHGEKAQRLPVKIPETGIDGSTRNVEAALFVPESMVREIRGIIDTDMKLGMNPVAKALTELQVMQAADAVAHTKNIHTVIASSLGTKSFFADVARKMPGLATADVINRIYDVSREMASDSPAIRAEMAEMAKNGMIRAKYPSTGIQKITRVQDAIHHVDTASRIVMNRFYDNLVERGLKPDSLLERRKYVQQIGEYNRRLMSPMMQAMSRSGLSPFIVAGRNFNRFGRRIVTGSYGGGAASVKAGLQMRAANLVLPIAVATVPAMLNYMNTGSVFGRRGTPLGAIDLNQPEDESGNHKVVDLAQLYGIRRGLRSVGAEAFVNGAMSGEPFSKVVDKAIYDVASTAAHPWMGPAIGGAYQTLTGKRLDLRGGPQPAEARKVGQDESQLAENARVALKNQNPLLYSLASPIFGDVQDSVGKDFRKAFLKSPFSAAGVRDVKTPELAKAKELAMSGGAITKESADKSKLKRGISAAIRNKDLAEKSKLMATPEYRQLTQADKTEIKQRSSMPPLDYTVHRFLSPKDAIEVYRVASAENQKRLRPIIEKKIQLNKTLSEEDKNALRVQMRGFSR